MKKTIIGFFILSLTLIIKNPLYQFKRNPEVILHSQEKSLFLSSGLRRIKELNSPKESQTIAEKVIEISNSIFGNYGQRLERGSRAIAALQYGDSQGFEFLRKQIATMVLRESGIQTDAKWNILVMDGFTEMRNALSIFINPGDTVLYQANSSLNPEMLTPFEIRGAELFAFDFNRDLGQLEEKLKDSKVKIIYLLSDTLEGGSLTQENKQKLYNIAKNHNTIIVEDASFRPLTGEKSLTLKSMDTNDRVVYLEDLSHLIGQGFRTSFAIAPYWIMKKLELAKQGFTLHPNCISQVFISEFISRTLGIQPTDYQSKNPLNEEEYTWQLKNEGLSFTEEDVKSLFGQTGRNLWPSVIRQLLKVVQDPSIISLAGGMPAAELFPFDAMKNILENLTAEEWQAVLNESPIKGLPQLIEAIKGWLGARGIYGEVLVTDGSQQGLDLIGQLLGKYGDKTRIITDLPTYIGALSGFSPYLQNAREQIIHFDLESLLNSPQGQWQLKETLKSMQEKGDKLFFYLTPTFGNPSGKIMSLEHRKLILSLAQELNIHIFEDDPYGEVRWYEGEKMPSLRELDNNGSSVTYLTSNSKVCAPGLRIGYIVGATEIIEELSQIKAKIAGPTNSLSQMLVAKFISSGWLDEHVQQVIIPEYKRRAQTMIEALRQYMPEGVNFTQPEGGLFVWVTLPPEIDTTMLLNKLAREGISVNGTTIKVAFVPGPPFNTDSAKLRNCLRLNFSNVGIEKIIQGVMALGEAVKQALLAGSPEK
ncbi:MAG: aminotransferase class I/II-fold pyridoxal phosphate-dependent enzyme [Candidatus Omnitrophica bacterium]|nr:aminotransferase class I/II-fold pyridoxal phosphate-dependent enzyme [Candidatus Omnitrophota bacterium]